MSSVIISRYGGWSAPVRKTVAFLYRNGVMLRWKKSKES